MIALFHYQLAEEHQTPVWSAQDDIADSEGFTAAEVKADPHLVNLRSVRLLNKSETIGRNGFCFGQTL